MDKGQASYRGFEPKTDLKTNSQKAYLMPGIRQADLELDFL
ncbi:MAG: hypothetical protein E6337_09495 [Ligilactobacillus salivarius]|nr:hypothetical protein [Ligilactobacillus salivarius]